MASCRLAGLVSLVAALVLAGCEARPSTAPAARSTADGQATQTATRTPAAALAQDSPAPAAVEPASGAGRAGESPQFARNVDEAMASLHREHEGD